MENISKIVVLREAGRKVGYVLDVALDEALRKVGFFVVDEESENEFFISKKNILSISDEFVLIEDASKLEFVADRNSSLMNKTVLDVRGHNLGRVQEMIFKGQRCEKIVTEKCEVASRLIRNVGEDFVIVGTKRRAKVNKNEFERLPEDMVVQIQNFQTAFKPESVSLSTNFYVGKTCDQDIFGYNNEKLIGRGEIITRAVVERIKKHNKLNQLFFAIKR